MPISPHLDDLLTQWLARGDELRKEVEFQKDLISPQALAAEGNRLAMRERRRRDRRHLEQTFMDAHVRWEERLLRIEEWRKSAADVTRQADYLQRLMQSMLWLKKARTNHQESFIRRVEKHAHSLRPAQQALQEKLDAWEPLMRERLTQLNELLQKDDREKPLFVSRARKQPEADFLNEQLLAGDAMGQDLAVLRRSLNHARNRLHHAFAAVENQAEGAEILYEVHKQEILGALKGAEKVLQERREEILSTALAYEGGRHLLKKVQEIVNALRCLEDIPQNPPRRGFRKLFTVRS